MGKQYLLLFYGGLAIERDPAIEGVPDIEGDQRIISSKLILLVGNMLYNILGIFSIILCNIFFSYKVIVV